MGSVLGWASDPSRKPNRTLTGVESNRIRTPIGVDHTVFYLLELLDLADRLEETFGFGPYYETSMRVFLRRVSYSVSCGCQTSRRVSSCNVIIYLSCDLV